MGDGGDQLPILCGRGVLESYKRRNGKFRRPHKDNADRVHWANPFGRRLLLFTLSIPLLGYAYFMSDRSQSLTGHWH